MAYNYFSDHSVHFSPKTTSPTNYRAIIMGAGFNFGLGVNDPGDPALRAPTTGTEIGWNFIDSSCSHTMEFKNIPDYVHHNHSTGLNGTFGGLNTRGWNADGPRTGTRPLFFANRIKCAQWQLNCRHIDYVSNYLVNSSGARAGTFNLFCPAQMPDKDHNGGISGADDCRMIGNNADVNVPFYSFEDNTYTYMTLGTDGQMLMAAHAGGAIEDGANATINFDTRTGLATGSHHLLNNNGLKQQGGVPTGFTLETPPILSASLTGPGVNGLTWAG
jgi:hypothetical protein